MEGYVADVEDEEECVGEIAEDMSFYDCNVGAAEVLTLVHVQEGTFWLHVANFVPRLGKFVLASSI